MGSKYPRRRAGIYYINGKEYDSITKIINDTLNKPPLNYWHFKRAIEVVAKELENFKEYADINVKDMYGKFLSLQQETKQRGKDIHAKAEMLLTAPINATIEVIEILNDSSYGSAFVSWFDTHRPNVLKTELEVYSEKYGFAGRLDLICEINGLKYLIDIKTGKQIYKESGIQLAAYRHCLEEMEITDIDKMGVVLLTKNGEFIFKETNDKLEDFLNVLKVFHWLKKKEG